MKTALQSLFARKRARPRPAIIVYRVQDRDGRGPWHGQSSQWADEDSPSLGLFKETVFDLIPLDQLETLPPTLFLGCACRTREALLDWFTPLERFRLAALGFQIVRLRADVIIAESPRQLLIGCVRPFTEGVTRMLWTLPGVQRK